MRGDRLTESPLVGSPPHECFDIGDDRKAIVCDLGGDFESDIDLSVEIKDDRSYIFFGQTSSLVDMEGKSDDLRTEI